MANDYEIFEFLEDDNSANNSLSKLRKRRLREECDPFNLDDSEFIYLIFIYLFSRYRLTKALVENLCEELRPLFKINKRSTDLSVETKVLTALSFYATGSYQRLIGNQEGHSMAQQTVSSVIAQVTACLNSIQFRQKYIHFPVNEQERNKIKAEFYNKFQMPGVLGCIDCTHVAIVRPVDHEERYYSRKHYHSLNVQVICDANMQIMNVDASHGGATHDSFIWSNHPLRSHLEELSSNENIWFLGDSGYPLRTTMMTPILNAAPQTPEAHYNNLHVRTRNIVERTIGLLKARFRCLLAHRVLHYSPQIAGSIVNVCVILHNICNTANISVQQLSNEEQSQENQLQLNYIVGEASLQHTNSSNVALQQGWAARRALTQELWTRRHL